MGVARRGLRAAPAVLRRLPALARSRAPRSRPRYLQLYVAAGRRYGIDPWILAGDRLGRDRPRPLHRARRALRRQRVRLLRGPDAVLGRRVAEHLGHATASTATTTAAPRRMTPPTRSPPPRATCGPPARRGDYHAALFAYNHADWYVDAGPRQGRPVPRQPPHAAGERRPARLERRGTRRARTTRGSRSRRSSARTCARGQIDARLIATLAWIARRHSVVDHRAEVRPLALHRRRHRLQPQRRARDGHRHRRRRGLPRHPHRPLRRPRARARRASRARCARPS